jgi:hypothetical protein
LSNSPWIRGALPQRIGLRHFFDQRNNSGIDGWTANGI